MTDQSRHAASSPLASADTRSTLEHIRQKAEELLAAENQDALEKAEQKQRLLELENELLRQELTTCLTSLQQEQERTDSLSRLLGIAAQVSDNPSMVMRLRTAEELAIEKTFVDAIFNSVPGMLYLYDEEGKLVRWNSKHEQMTGYTSEELFGMKLLDWYRGDPVSQKAVTAGVERTITTGFGEAFADLQKKDGSTIPMYFTASLLNIHGKQYFVGIGLDITEQKKAEGDRATLQQQLIQSQKMESVGRLAGGVAHDFNNMLSVILGHTEIILSELDQKSPLQTNLQEIYAAAQRSADLTRQLLGFARKQTIAPRPLDLNKTVDGMLKMLRWLIGEDIELTWIPQERLQSVKMDPTQLDQILANLCVNARDAIDGVGKITIETGYVTFDQEYCDHHLGFRPGNYIMLAVSDNGVGIDRETLKYIFEPYFTTKESGKGTGLGLSTVYGIVKQNNGFINVYSEVEQGTSVCIYLPICQEETTTSGTREANWLKMSSSHETILLVEDEQSILELTTAMLERLGYKVIAAPGPAQAMEIAKKYKEPLDLLITDVVMPYMNGRDLSANLQSLYPGLKTLFISGYTANVIAHHNVLDPGVHFLPKPFSLGELAEAIHQILMS